METSRIHHIAIITSDYDKTIDFYVKKLGFKIAENENKNSN